MMTTADENIVVGDTRTKHEAILDVLYGIQFNDMNERFYRRMDGIFSVITILGGSAVFAAFLGSRPGISGTLGLLIAAIAYLDREIRPAMKAVLCGQQRGKFGDLAARTQEMSLTDIDRELRQLQSHGPATVTALAEPALRANLRSNGYPIEEEALPWFSRLACLLI